MTRVQNFDVYLACDLGLLLVGARHRHWLVQRSVTGQDFPDHVSHDRPQIRLPIGANNCCMCTVHTYSFLGTHYPYLF